jgi:transposase
VGTTPDQQFNFNLTGPLTREQAEFIYTLGREAVIYALMILSAQETSEGGESPVITPSTPSGMIPVYEKPAAPKRRKKPGAKIGHQGYYRQLPPITHHQEQPPLRCCPDCGTPFGQPSERRTRVIEDIADMEPVVTEHTIPRHWCPKCKKMFEPPVPDALPKATFGHRLVAFSAWLHYGLGATIAQIISVLGHHLQFRLSEGGLVDAWQRLAALLLAWYEEIGQQIKQAGVLHADETGWRLAGKTVWLWCFSSTSATYYMIDRSRGSPALSKFFKEAFDGILITDFWGAYNAVVCTGRQTCLPHLLRELKKVDDHNGSAEWIEFSKKLGRLLKDAIRLKKKDLPEPKYQSLRSRLDLRLDYLIEMPWRDADVKRLVKRLRRYRQTILTFLDYPEVPSDNNHAEREIRPAVIMRKNSQGNRSGNGANAQAIFMSVYRTLKLRGLDPLDTIVSALKIYVVTGSLPPLPEAKLSVN